MKLILTHEHPDFDAVASLALAKLVHPGAVAALRGSLPEAVRGFVHLYRDLLDLRDAAEIDPDEVSELIVVDTADRRRIRPFDVLVGKVPITVYDHHPTPAEPIPAARGIQEAVGATATLLTRQLATAGVRLEPAIATLALLGIHEDTGSLRYAPTSADDYAAAAYLLECGASLELVRQFSQEQYGPEHRRFLQLMLEHAKVVPLGGYQVVTSAFRLEDYLPGVAGLCNELLSLYSADAALLAVGMEDKTLLFARASRGFDVGAALAEAFGGGGHPGAAFARLDADELPPGQGAEGEGAPDAVIARALDVLPRHSRPLLRARELMSSPVKTIRERTTVAQAQRLLLQFGHNGVPVTDDRDRLVGIISRRDLDRALRHGLGRSAVKGFMAREVITATPDTSMTELEELIRRHNIGRIPILEGERLVGIVTRSDLLAARHPRPIEGDMAAAQRVLARLPSGALEAIDRARAVLADLSAESGRAALYLVGGTTRDALLGHAINDLDLVVEGVSAERLGTHLQQALGGDLSCHLAFGTCTLTLPNGLILDLASAREEYYEHPGALPTVTPSTLRKDLSRRDYSVNAIALRLYPEPPELIDPYHGRQDLENRVLRLLHPLSFIEDPTRLLRGARLAGRLNLHFDEVTRERARAALTPDVLGRTSRSRLRAELELTTREPRVAPALLFLDDLGALEAMFGMRADAALLEALDRRRSRGPLPDEAYLLALLLRLPDEQVEAQFEAYHWPRRFLQARSRLRAIEERGRVREAELENLSPAARAVVAAFGREFEKRVLAFETVPRRRRLRGQDVLDLGLSPGPRVGEILEKVARARAQSQVTSFEEELELARKLIRQGAEPPPDR